MGITSTRVMPFSLTDGVSLIKEGLTFSSIEFIIIKQNLNGGGYYGGMENFKIRVYT